MPSAVPLVDFEVVPISESPSYADPAGFFLNRSINDFVIPLPAAANSNMVLNILFDLMACVNANENLLPVERFISPILVLSRCNVSRVRDSTVPPAICL